MCVCVCVKVREIRVKKTGIKSRDFDLECVHGFGFQGLQDRSRVIGRLVYDATCVVEAGSDGFGRGEKTHLLD